MVFSSTVFLFLFLPFTLILHFLLHPRFRNAFLLLMSMFFYAWGEGALTLLIAISILVNYAGGLLISYYKARSEPAAKATLAVFIAINLLVLIYYKYFNFILGALQSAGWMSDVPLPEKHLPIGISFYTFHILSYLVDVYRRDARVQKNPFDLGLYIFLFPQLVAGPIIRYKDISAKIASRFIAGDEFTKGVIRFIRGLAKKMVIANAAAVIADAAFAEQPEQLPVSMAWLGIVAYTLQIYFDFSGYSDMALGLGKMLGFNFPENFNYPYVARSIKDFWQRWHISLSTWFRDYLYIPLGGNKHGKARTLFNLLLVFFITGLWHGAGWNFIVWGLFHGFFLIIERLGFDKLLQKLPRVVQHAYTLLVVMLAWGFFRANDLSGAIGYLKAMAGSYASENYIVLLPLTNYVVAMLILGIICSTRIRPFLESRLTPKLGSGKVLESYLVMRYVVYLLLFLYCTTELAQQSYNPFIYFRF
jgi:alginate O-acetyltransferase complex protein AlgI